MKHIIVPNLDRDIPENKWGLDNRVYNLIRNNSTDKYYSAVSPVQDSNPWDFDLIVVSPGAFTADNTKNWKRRCDEIGEYVVWHHFGGKNSENYNQEEINKKWPDWNDCLESENLRKAGGSPCFFPFSMNSDCKRPWDIACQELCAVVRETRIDTGRLQRALTSLDNAVAPAIRHFLGRPADLLEHLFPVMLAIQGGLEFEEAKRFLPEEDEVKMKIKSALIRWQNEGYWDGISFLAPDEERSLWIRDAAQFSTDFMSFFEDGKTKETQDSENLWTGFVSVCKLIREDERPG